MHAQIVSDALGIPYADVEAQAGYEGVPDSGQRGVRDLYAGRRKILRRCAIGDARELATFRRREYSPARPSSKC